VVDEVEVGEVVVVVVLLLMLLLLPTEADAVAPT